MTGNPRNRGKSKKGGKKKLPGGSTNALVVSGSVQGNMCVIKVHVWNPLAPEPRKIWKVDALIDTGATSTAINQGLADLMGVQVRTATKMMGATGEHEAGQAPVGIGFLTNEGRDISKIVPMAVLPMGQGGPPILFGMTELLPGRLVVNGPDMTWKWVLPETGVNQSSK